MNDTVVNISWCADHVKNGLGFIHAQDEPSFARPETRLHEQWLEQAVDYYRRENWPVCVSMIGACDLGSSDTLCRITAKTEAVLISLENPGHQEGACLALALGLKAAKAFGFRHLIHTAEDILPEQGVLQRMQATLQQGYAYCGEPYHDGELTSAFFGVQVEALVGKLNRDQVLVNGYLERYLTLVLQGASCYTKSGSFSFFHSHDYQAWRHRWEELTDYK